MFNFLKKQQSSASTLCSVKTNKLIYIFLFCIMLFALCSCSKKIDNHIIPTQTQSATANSEETILPVNTPSEPTETPVSTTTSDSTSTTESTVAPEVTATPDATTTPDISSTPEATTSKPTATTSTACAHKSITIKNKSKATCTKDGYTGDTYCLMCGEKVSSGSKIPATGHANTELRNYKESTSTQQGYTGDVYCKDCGIKIESGTTLPKIENPNAGKIEYILPDGSSAFVDANISDITGHYMAEKTQITTHLYVNVEKDIVSLCNIERAKENLPALSWFEDAYYFTKIRAEETATLFSHTRPNGKPWYSVCFDAGVVITGYYGENLGKTNGATPEQFAKAIVDSWMNSPAHRANIMNGNYRRIAVAIVQNGDQLTAVQFFFS